MPHRVSTPHVQGSQRYGGESIAIDLQKMNWKCRTGFHEYTGVFLKEHAPNNLRGGYTRAYQNTAQSCDRQRPSQLSSARLSARCCAIGAAPHRIDRSAGASGAHCGVVRALGPELVLSL